MVDIIVPIYNAYKAVDECIASIIKHTDLNKNRLILINDKSTDETILGLLNTYKEKNPDGYEKSQFYEYFNRFIAENYGGQKGSMAVNRIPGEKMYIDWL